VSLVLRAAEALTQVLYIFEQSSSSSSSFFSSFLLLSSSFFLQLQLFLQLVFFSVRGGPRDPHGRRPRRRRRVKKLKGSDMSEESQGGLLSEKIVRVTGWGKGEGWGSGWAGGGEGRLCLESEREAGKLGRGGGGGGYFGGNRG
jgi:hypothetical protein